MCSKCSPMISATVITMALLAGNSVAETTEINLSFIGDTNSLAYQGAQQGRDEANIQGRFMGQNYTLNASPEDSTAIVAAVDAESLRKLSASHPNKTIFNLTAEDDALRSECLANVVHIIPSKAMKRDAEAQWLQKNPDSSAKAQTWHPTFRKYAASQLNSRFSKTHSVKMDDTAWAGWAAVKILSDSVVRGQTSEAQTLLNFIKSDLAFDGQKGISLNVRNTGQLRQPLLLIENDKIAGEAPVRGVTKTSNLDSLGLASCPK